MEWKLPTRGPDPAAPNPLDSLEAEVFSRLLEEPPLPKKLEPGEKKPTMEDLEDDPVLAAAHLARIKDRDDDSEIVPFKVRWIQQQFFDLVSGIQAFNIFRTTLRSKIPLAKETLAQIIGVSGLPSRAQDAVPLIQQKLPNRVLKRMRKLGFKDVSDSPVRICAVKPRRVGLSTAIAWLMTHRMVTRPNVRALVFGHEGTSAEEALGITNGFFQDWPEDGLITPFPGAEPERPELINDAATVLKLKNRSKYSTKVASGKLDARGFQFDIFHMTEFAHYPNTRIISSARSGIPKHAWQFIESTANGPQGEFYRTIQRAKKLEQVLIEYDEKVSTSEKVFFLFFVNWLQEPGYIEHVEPWEEQQILDTRDEYEIALQAKYPEATVGRLKWRRNMIANECQGHDELTPEAFFAQEYPVDLDEAFQKGANSVFDPKFISGSRNQIKLLPSPRMFTIVDRQPPVQRFHAFQANTWIWEPPQPGVSYAFGVDVSKGLKSKDRSWITIGKRIDDIRIEQVGEWYGWISQPGLAYVTALLAEWYNDAFVIPEINDAIAYVTALTEWLGYYNVYIRKTLDSQVAQNAWKYGFLTANRQAKVTLINQLQYDTQQGNYTCRSEAQLHEMEIYQRLDDGGFSAPEGDTDDGVMSAALLNFGHPTRRGAPPIKPKEEREKKKNEFKEMPGLAFLPQVERDLIARIDNACKLLDEQHAENELELQSSNNPFVEV